MEIFDNVYSIITNQWLSFIMAAFLAAMFSFGWRKGMVKMSFSIASFFLSIALSRMLLPYVQTAISNNQVMTEWLQEKLENILYSNTISSLNSYGVESNMDGIQDGVQGMEGGTEVIDSFYHMLGLDRLTEFAAEQIAKLVISVLIFIFLLIISRLLLKIVFYILDGIMHLPGLNLINRSCGGILGLAEGLFYIWLFILLIGILPQNSLSVEIARQCGQLNSLSYYIKEGNLILRIFASVLSIRHG